VSRSRLCGLLGDDIATSFSAELHEQEGRAQGLTYVYRLLDTTLLRGGVGAVLDVARAAGFDGLNVTQPYKRAVLRWVDEVTPDIAELGASNTLVVDHGRVTAHNTDRGGFARALQEGLPSAELGHVVLVGAGGAGAAVGAALLDSGAARLTVVDLDDDAAADVVRRLARRDGGPVDAATPANLPGLLGSATGVVNASPVGSVGSPGSPVPASLLHPGLWVADIVYRPVDTQLLTEARAAGCPVLDGTGMVALQAAETFELVTGVTPDAARMRRHARQLALRQAHPHRHTALAS